jgi:hypothetical protein
VVLDEADGIDTDIISNMSGIRSSCVAERTIAGGTRKTIARTRLIWLANPRGFKTLAHYATGIEAVQELIGKPEDIARFDFALAISQKDVPMEIINKKPTNDTEHKFTSVLCNKLLLWGWSRKEENIIFKEDAVDEILKASVAFGKMFSSDIPLVHPNEQRIKLARLSAALAILTFNTEDYENVTVEKHHVKYIIDYLIDIYSSPALNYLQYSQDKILGSTIENEDEVLEKILSGFYTKIEDSNYNPKYFVEKLLTAQKLSVGDIGDALQEQDKSKTNEVKQYLLIQRCIIKSHSYWLVTQPFRYLLRKIQYELRGKK